MFRYMSAWFHPPPSEFWNAFWNVMKKRNYHSNKLIYFYIPLFCFSSKRRFFIALLSRRKSMLCACNAFLSAAAPRTRVVYDIKALQASSIFYYRVKHTHKHNMLKWFHITQHLDFDRAANTCWFFNLFKWDC